MSGEAVLCIGGLDPSGGAGILADIKTLHQLRVQGFGAITSVTYQNENFFYGLDWLDEKQLFAQIEPLIEEDYPVSVVKVGLINNLGVLGNVLGFLHQQFPGVRVVWDPVMGASAGFAFHDSWNQDQLKRVLSMVYCITPNLLEWNKLKACEAIDWNDPPVNIIQKGGHGEGHLAVDKLIMTSGETLTEETKKIEGADTHGTGCAFASALAAFLAQGYHLSAAFKRAKEYVNQLIQTSEGKLGNHHLVQL